MSHLYILLGVDIVTYPYDSRVFPHMFLETIMSLKAFLNDTNIKKLEPSRN